MSGASGDNFYEYLNGVLRNKQGITDAAQLQQIEATAVSFRLLELSAHPLPGRFDLDHLKAIHHHIFHDIYDWAGGIAHGRYQQR